MPTPFSTVSDGQYITSANHNAIQTAINNLETSTSFYAGATAGTGTAYTATLSPAPGTLVAGFSVVILPHATNGAAATLNLNAGGAVGIYWKNAAIAAGQLLQNVPYWLVFDGTHWQVQNPGGDVAGGGTGANLSATGGASQVLLQTSAGAAISVRQLTPADLGAGTFAINGVFAAGFAFSGVSTKTAAYTLTANDTVVVANSAGAITFTLPAANGSGRVYILPNLGAGTLTVAPNGADKINAANTSQTVAQYGVLRLLDQGTAQWLII